MASPEPLNTADASPASVATGVNIALLQDLSTPTEAAALELEPVEVPIPEPRAHAAPTFFVLRDGLAREASTVTGLTQQDLVFLHSGRFQVSDAALEGTRLSVTPGGRFPDLSIDIDTSASQTSPVVFEGARGTSLFLAPILPALAEAIAVDPALVNGIPAQAALTGDSTTLFRVSLGAGTADFANALGVYEVTSDGSLVDAQILFANAKNSAGAEAVISGVEDGHRLGFFVVQDGADWAAGLSDTDTLDFRAADGGAGTLQDGADLVLHAGGMAAEHTVLHSLDPVLNQGGTQHALSGIEAGANALMIGFEDQAGGDQDFQDVLLTVTMEF